MAFPVAGLAGRLSLLGLEYAQNSLAQKVKSDLPRHLVFFLFFIA